MSRTYYQIYKEQTFVLARTLIVKHEEIASSMNTELHYRGYTIDSNPYNWRYYLNLSGEYHQADKDELYENYGTQYMMVKIPSLLGSVEVPLTKDLLHGINADKTMMNEYQLGSKFYEELVSRYPEFETLIIGIINPIDINVALNADNGEILFIAGRYKRIEDVRKYFDTTWYSINEVLIEEQEDNLILEIQKFINTFLKHWSNPEYINGNDLYVVAMLGVLYSNIPNTIFNIRLGNCKTPRAHTFHIRQYLESFGQIGRYVDFVPIGTVLWLYKNVHYLEANAGKQKTFDLIMDNMLTPNEIPMSAYTARHELTNMSDDNPLPNSMFYKEVLNFSIVGASDDDRTVLDILEDQKDLARDNGKDLAQKEIDIQSTLDWGGDDRLNTKVLESEMIDIGEPYPFTLSQMLFNMWGYTVVKGYYVGTTYATNPLTGDRLSFNAKNAYILAMYCLNKAIAGVELERIPKIKLYGVPRTDQPDDYPTDPSFLKKPDINKMMSWCVDGVTRRLKVLEVRGTHIPQFNAQDSEQFFDNVEEMYLERIRRYNTYCDIENLEERGDLELVAKRLYWLGFEETLLDMDYDQWFRSVGFDASRFTNDDLLSIGLELVASATGVSEQDDVRKKWLQKSLLAILKHFISYTVHVIEKYTDGVVAYLEGQTLRYSNFKWTYIEPLQKYYNLALDYKLATYANFGVRFDITNIFENTKVSVNTTGGVSLDLSNIGFKQYRHTLDIGTYQLGAKLFNIEFNTEKQEPVYIIIIDDSINTILIKPIVGNSIDANFIYSMDPELSYIKPYDINTAITDLNRIVNMLDDNREGITIDGSYAVVTDSPKGVGGSRTDNGGVLPQGMFAGAVDASITDIGFVDSNATSFETMRATVVDHNSNASNTPDGTSTGIIEISAGFKDVDRTTYGSDDNIINITNMEIGFADPQIPPVDNTADIHQVSITAMLGASRDVNITNRGLTDNVVVIRNLDADSVDDEVLRSLGIHSHVAQIGSMFASTEDTNNPDVILDSSTITIATITMSIVDDSVVISNTESNGVVTDNIHASVVDSGNVMVSDDNHIGVTDISAIVIDDSINTSILTDNDTTNIDSIVGDVNDNNQVIDTPDSNSMNVGSVVMSHLDDMVTVPRPIENNTVIISNNINIEYNDTCDVNDIVDSATIILSDITGSSVEKEIDYNAADNGSVVINTSLISITMLDADVALLVVDDEKQFVKTSDVITASLSDDSYVNETTDDNAIDIDDLTIAINDEDLVINTKPDDTTAIINSDEIHADLMDSSHTLNNTDDSTVIINSDAINATVVDYSHTLNNTDVTVVDVSSNNISLLANDSDIMIDGVDSASIGISSITMNLIDES